MYPSSSQDKWRAFHKENYNIPFSRLGSYGCSCDTRKDRKTERKQQQQRKGSFLELGPRQTSLRRQEKIVQHKSLMLDLLTRNAFLQGAWRPPCTKIPLAVRLLHLQQPSFLCVCIYITILHKTIAWPACLPPIPLDSTRPVFWYNFSSRASLKASSSYILVVVHPRTVTDTCFKEINPHVCLYTSSFFMASSASIALLPYK